MILDATPYDIAQLGFLGKSFVERSNTGRYMSYDEPGFVNNLFRLVSMGIMRIWVAKENDRIVGAISLLMVPNFYNPGQMIADIPFVDVLPEHQKKGIARDLLNTVELFCVGSGIKVLTISFKKPDLGPKFGFEVFETKFIKKVGE